MEDDIIVPMPSGPPLSFPAGTSPAVIERVKARISAQADAPLPPSASAGEPQATPATPATPFERALTSPPGRMAAGVVLDRVNPMAETLARVFGQEKPVQEANNEMAQRYAEARGAAGQSGVDIPRHIGPAVLDYYATRGALGHAGKPHIANPKNLPDIAKAGGAAGAFAGAAGPVEGSDQMDGLEYALKKSLQTIVGGGAGAVAAPLFTAGIEGAMGLGAKGVNAVKNFIAPSAPVKLANDPQALEAYLAGQAANAGVNWANVPDAVRESLRQATKRATSATGKMPDAAVQNRLLAEKEGLPQLTTGQATRDPVQFSREANNPDPELRNRINQQATAVTDRLAQVPNQFGPPRTPYEVGDTAMADIVAQATARRKQIDNLYTTARSTEGKTSAIQNISEWANETQQELQRLGLVNGDKGLRTIDPDLYLNIANLAGSKRGSRMTVEKAVDILQGINARGTQGQPALQTVKTQLQKFLDDRAVFLDQDVGSTAVKAFGEARKARAELGKWEESSKAIADLASREPKTAREQMFNKFVVNGGVDDFRNMWATLTPTSHEAIKRQFVERVTNTALSRTGSDATNYGSALKMLREFPPEKLKTMFPGEELQRLKSILEYARLTKEAPAGNFVNRSGTSQAILDFISSGRNIPLAGPWAAAPAKALREQVQGAGALNGALALPATPWYTPGPKGLDAAARVAPYVGTGALSTVLGAE